MTTTYTCENFRPIKRDDDIENIKAAAKIFAGRIAREQYGKRGFCHHVRADCRREDGAYHIFEAFIGVPVKGDLYACSGRNVWLTVYVHNAEEDA